MRYYDYPPSEQIKQFEQFEPNSHFYARGKCIFQGHAYPCEFEVAYTLKGDVYVILYASLDDINEIFGIEIDGGLPWKTYVSKQEAVNACFVGRELRNGYGIRIENAVSIRGWNGLDDQAPMFQAKGYSVKVNLGTFRHVSKQGVAEFEITNISAPDAWTNGQTVTIPIGSGVSLNLRMALRLSGENSILSVSPSDVPVGMTAQDVADTWCTAASFALGTDVRWIVMRYFSESKVVSTFRSRNNIIRDSSTYKMLPVRFDFWSDPLFNGFSACLFDSVRTSKVSIEALRDYLYVMRRFVEYRLITQRIEDQARLISTTVEEFVRLWEQHTGFVPSAVITSDGAKELWKKLNDDSLAKSIEMIGIKSRQERNALITRLETAFLKEIVRPGFNKRLKNMLKKGQNSEAWVKEHAVKRLNGFVDTRNRIAHDGEFQSKETEELLDYYYQMIMIIPLLVFSIFGYSDKYEDLSSKYRGYLQNKKSSHATPLKM